MSDTGLSRQFIKLAGAAAASAGALSLSDAAIFAAQPARKRIVIHGERQVTSLGYHNRRETEHVSMVDAGLVGQNPVTSERVAVLAEELPSVKKGTWKIDTEKKTMITVYKLRPGLKWHDGKPYTSPGFRIWLANRQTSRVSHARSVGARIDFED